MPTFEVVVSRAYYKTFRYHVEAPDLATAELMDYERGELVGEDSLTGGEDEVVEVKQVEK